MRQSLLTKRTSFLNTPAWLALVLALLVGMLGFFPTSPTLASSDELLNAISLGLYHTCGITADGTLTCWGYDGYGQVSGPNGSSDTFTQVSAGGNHTCGLRTDGSLACWGNNDYGQVSGPNGSVEAFTQISAGGLHTCGLKTDGSLACWGHDGHDQVSGPNGSAEVFTQVSTGSYHTCGVKADGTLGCWGDDWYEQVSGPNDSSAVFTQVNGGGYHTCGVKTDGTLVCWGHDWYGQVSSPNASVQAFTQVGTGFYHTCALKTDGGLACWGYNGYGQVSGPNGSQSTFIQVSGGGFDTCRLKADLSLACWGNNDYGQAPPSNLTPTDIALSNDDVDENQPVNAEVGALTTTDSDAGDTHIYSLMNTASCLGPDNAAFGIDVDMLRTSAAFDYETKNTFTVCIRTDDGNGGTYDEQFVINVNNINEAPANTVPGTQSTKVNTSLAFSASNGNPIIIDDVDADDNPLKVTLTASNGTLTLNGTSGLAFSSGDGNADANMVFTGTTGNINAALDGVSFSPTLSYNGPASIHVVTDDQGNTGSGGALTDDDTVDILIEPAPAPSGSRIFLPLLLHN